MEFDAERFLDFVEFVLNGGMVKIAICVVFSEDVESFLVAPFCDEPTR